MITFAAINNLPKIRHAFLTREGGVSDGVYGSLNCGYGSMDSREKVTENRARALTLSGLRNTKLVTASQEHTATVEVVHKPWVIGEAPVADGMVTDKPNIALGILTADCAPVLLADGVSGIIGAAHAGWRGAKNGVLDATIEAMVNLGAKTSEIVAGIGPCIAQRSYEVSDEFAEPFLRENQSNHDLFVPSRRSGHLMFDLPGYVARRLSVFKLKHVVRSPCDTCLEANRFYSYRRSVLVGEPDYGRELSLISIE